MIYNINHILNYIKAKETYLTMKSGKRSITMKDMKPGTMESIFTTEFTEDTEVKRSQRIAAVIPAIIH